jgi:Domain of unknown function (DUF4145)
VAEINKEGNIRSKCPGCSGAFSMFEWIANNAKPYGAVIEVRYDGLNAREVYRHHRLFRCAGCGQGGIGVVLSDLEDSYPRGILKLLSFYPEVHDRAILPMSVPEGIKNEFREGETCLDAGAIRAAAGMFRSVLDKTLRANGYKTKPGTNLAQQIDEAAKDGVITESRKKRAHDEIRVLGNDVLHDEWQQIAIEDVELSRHYALRILEDFYDDRDSVLALLRAKSRVPDEDKSPVVAATTA